MTRTILVTGAASGINAAVSARLRRQGCKLISVDVREIAIDLCTADIVADLGSPDSRARIISGATRLAQDGCYY